MTHPPDLEQLARPRTNHHVVRRRCGLDELAGTQAGIVARRQLLGAGWPPVAVERAVAGRQLVPVARGVYRLCGAPWDRAAARHAAVLLVGDDAVLAGWTAAELHGLADPREGPVDVCAPVARRRPAGADDLLRLTRTRSLPVDEVAEVAGLPVTSVARTLLDLAAHTTTGRLAELIATATRVTGCRPPAVQRVLAAHPRAQGRGRLTSALALLGDDGTAARSEVEIAALHAIVDAGLPRPVVAHRVVDDRRRFVAEVDLAYPDRRIAIEIDGFAWHSSPDRKRRDEQRQNALVLAGWTVLRFSAAEVRRRPHVVVTAVQRALEAA